MSDHTELHVDKPQGKRPYTAPTVCRRPLAEVVLGTGSNSFDVTEYGTFARPGG